MIDDVPVVSAVTTPEPSTVATEVLLLVQLPPPLVVDNVVLPPVHKFGEPDKADGKACTVNTLEVRQPVGNLYVIFAVPGVTPFTTPLDTPTTATKVFPLDHVPPVEAVLSVPDKPWHIAAGPVIVSGTGLTVINLVA